MQRFVIDNLIIYPEPTTATCTLPRGCNTISHSPCLNDGLCVSVPGVTEGASYNCSCTDGYFGSNCQFFDICTTMPCENGGECFTDQSNLNRFICVCPDSFTGQLCETRVSSCAGNPCLNQATCQEVGAEDFECVCPPGYTGALCGENIDDCRENPCQNGGTCVDDVNSFSCDCPPEFSGPTCEVQVVFCSLNSCQNGGTCSEVEGGMSCSCLRGYTGDICEININECEDNPCENGATCADLIGDFFCLCGPAFTGPVCNETIDFCANQSCSGNGECIALLTEFECHCNPGYTGVECEVDIDECASYPCENNATCLEGINLFMCLCPNGFTGLTCETEINECSSLPCENGATCFDLVDGFACACPPAFTGPTCNTQSDFCIDQVCYSGGSCISSESGFMCLCPIGWSGPQCQFADNVAVKLSSCGLFSHDYLNDSGYADPVAFSSGSPAISESYGMGMQPEGLYWSAWIWHQNATATTLFSYVGQDIFQETVTELVSDISSQQLRFYHSLQDAISVTSEPVAVINASLSNVLLTTHNWHHLSVVLWRNGTASISVDGASMQVAIFTSTRINPPGSEVQQTFRFSLPPSFTFTLAPASVSLPTQSQSFTGIMRGVAIAEIPSAETTDPLDLDQCLLNCIGGDDFCLNGGQCQDLIGPHRQCDCPYGFSGLQCQYRHDRISFDGTGYAELLSGLLSTPLLNLTFGFKTEATTGELGSHRGLFSEDSLSLNDEKLVLDVQFCDFTNDSVVLQPSSSAATLSDNQWHTVALVRDTIQVDDVSTQLGPFQIPGCNNSDPGRILLGSFSDTVDTSNNFAGCLRELLYDGALLDTTSIQLFGGAEFGCDRDTAQFFATSFIELPSFNSREAQTISLEFSTLVSEAILYFSRRVPADATGPNPSDFVAIYLEGGCVTFTFNLGEGDITVRNSKPVHDGDWHRIEAMQNSTLSWLSVDGARVQTPVVSQLELLDTTGSVFLGGVPTDEQLSSFNQYVSFDGCLRDLEQNGVAADLRNSTASQYVHFGACN